jgi:hypothetical protein
VVVKDEEVDEDEVLEEGDVGMDKDEVVVVGAAVDSLTIRINKA